MTFSNPHRRPRYGCQECREDCELVMSGRATSEARTQYEVHLRDCPDCRRMHRVLHAVYDGAIHVPPALSPVQQDRQFAAILRRARAEAPDPWWTRLSIRAGIVALSASAAALALSLFDLAPNPLPEISSPPPAGIHALQRGTGQTGGSADGLGGIDHPAQSYGRVVGGDAVVLLPEGEPTTSSTFPVGTRFRVGLTESLQVALAGKIVANFTPGSEVEWSVATPNVLELNLSRGLVAMRYDRRPSDPILHVRTPRAIVRVVGTVFTVQVDSDENTVVSVLRGEVEVLNRETQRLLAEVEAGYRFDISNATFADVGKIEVAAALPLSNDRGAGTDPADADALATGTIPSDWAVPGLPPNHRTLAFVSVLGGATRVTKTRATMRPQPISAPSPRVQRVSEDDGDTLIQHLMRDAEATRRKELRNWLERCRNLYDDGEHRYLAAECLAKFLDKYGQDPLAVEGYLLVGILRMDYALDYRAADTAFTEFLRRAPGHPEAELAFYRLWLSSTEDGRISEALEHGRRYLERYRQGRYVGKILRRFPELKSVL